MFAIHGDKCYVRIMRIRGALVLLAGALLLSAALNVSAQQVVFNKVKVRFNRSDEDRRLIDKEADLVLDDTNQRLIVKSIERPLDVPYQSVEKVIFEITTHMRGGALSQLLYGAAAVVPGASVGGVALASRHVKDYWFYLSYRQSGQDTKPYLMEVSRDSSDEVIEKAKRIFGDRVMIVDFPEKAMKVDKDTLKDLQSKHQLKINRKSHPLPELKPDKALVVVVCPPLAARYAGQGYQVKLHANDSVVAVNRLGTYSFAYLDPGNYRLVSQVGNASAVEITLEAGKDYYFLQETFMGSLKSGTVLSRHTKELVMYELSGAYYADWKRFR